FDRDWSPAVCSSDLSARQMPDAFVGQLGKANLMQQLRSSLNGGIDIVELTIEPQVLQCGELVVQVGSVAHNADACTGAPRRHAVDRKSTRLNSSHDQ